MGPNGAGKTTLFNIISGFISPNRGKVYLKEEEITSLSPYLIARRGLVRTFQDARAFNHLTVLENIEVAIPHNGGIDFRKKIFPFFESKLVNKFIRIKAREYLELIDLSNLQNKSARSLTFGQQRLLGIARALACQPSILLLDEPSAGLNQDETNALMRVIKEIHKKNMTIFIIEHNIGMLMNLAERTIVLDKGKKIMEGTPEEIKKEETVLEAYFGRKNALPKNYQS